MGELLTSLRLIREDIANEEPPDDGALPGEHWTFVWHKALGVMLTARFWLVVLAVAFVAAALDSGWLGR